MTPVLAAGNIGRQMGKGHDYGHELPAAGGAAERYKQTYPELTAKEIDRLRRFGEIKQYAGPADYC